MHAMQMLYQLNCIASSVLLLLRKQASPLLKFSLRLEVFVTSFTLVVLSATQRFETAVHAILGEPSRL